MQNQTQLQQQQPDDTFDPEDSPMKLAVKQMSGLLSKVPKDVLKNVTLASMRPRNWTLPANFSQQVVSALRNMSVVENGMTALEVAKALMTGTISSNTADANTPDIGLSDVQSGAININPFIDGAAMSNALTLAGREATANSRGIVFGMVGTGRSSNDATALGRTGAASSTDAFVINGGGLNQNAMSSNLALTPQGPADTSVRAASFNIIGGTTSGGLTNAIGKKGADSAGLGATMTGARRHAHARLLPSADSHALHSNARRSLLVGFSIQLLRLCVIAQVWAIHTAHSLPIAYHRVRPAPTRASLPARLQAQARAQLARWPRAQRAMLTHRLLQQASQVGVVQLGCSLLWANACTH